MDLEPRARRIVETAVQLAEEGGFEAVRLRDVAAHADVALGTLYRRFRSKEDLLVAALDLETAKLEQRMLARPPTGETHLDRVTSLFATITRNFCRRPHLARALLKATVSGDASLAQRVADFHERIERMIVAALRGKSHDAAAEPASESERSLAWSLEFVWYSLIIGWSGSQYTQTEVNARTREAARLMIQGWEHAR